MTQYLEQGLTLPDQLAVRLIEYKQLGFEDGVMEALLYCLQGHHDESFVHSLEVSSTAYKLARFAKLPEDLLEKIFKSGLLHDIGKLGITKELLNKRPSLTSDEISLLRTHGKLGFSIVELLGLDPFYGVVADEHHLGNSNHYQASQEELKSRHPLIPYISIADSITVAGDPLRPWKDPQSLDDAESILLEKINQGIFPNSLKDPLITLCANLREIDNGLPRRAGSFIDKTLVNFYLPGFR